MEESLGPRLLKQIKEVCEVAGIKTEEYARVSRKRLDVMSIDRQITHEKASLGGRIYELAGREAPGNPLDDVTVQATIERIKKLELSLAECQKEIESIQVVARSRATDVKRRYREGQGPDTDDPEPSAPEKPDAS